MEYLHIVQHALHHNFQLAKWYALMGVTGEQFAEKFKHPEYANISEQLPAYHRYCIHLRDVLNRLNDEDVEAYIRIPSHPDDNLLNGYLYRPKDETYLMVSYNGVDGITLSNAKELILGGIPPVCKDSRLEGNFAYISKNMRDIAFKYAYKLPDTFPRGKFERVTDDRLDEDRIRLLAAMTLIPYGVRPIDREEV